MREAYTKQLEDLNRQLEEMGQLLITQIEAAMRCFRSMDSNGAQKVISMDKVCNDKVKEIEQLSLTLLLLQQPVASDLRNVSSALKMTTDMERMGDQAADIAELVTDMKDVPISKLSKTLEGMYDEVITLVINTMNSFQEKESKNLIHLMEDDDKIDALFLQVKNEAIEVIRTKSEAGHDVLDCLMVAKHLEKIGDYAVHVIRWIYFYLVGSVPDKPKSTFHVVG